MKFAGTICIYTGVTAFVTMLAALVDSCPNKDVAPCTSYVAALMEVAPYTIGLALMVGLLHAGGNLLEKAETKRTR